MVKILTHPLKISQFIILLHFQLWRSKKIKTHPLITLTLLMKINKLIKLTKETLLQTSTFQTNQMLIQ